MRDLINDFFIVSGCDESPSRYQPDQACDAGRLRVQATGKKSGAVSLISYYRVIHSTSRAITLLNFEPNIKPIPMTNRLFWQVLSNFMIKKIPKYFYYKDSILQLSSRTKTCYMTASHGLCVLLNSNNSIYIYIQCLYFPFALIEAKLFSFLWISSFLQ